MIIGIYGVIHRPTGRWYVGRSLDIIKRWRGHRTSARNKPSSPFYEALRSYPADEFLWVVLQTCNADEMNTLEEVWILKLGAFNRGYNCTSGGDSTPSDRQEIRKKMSDAQKRRTDRPFLGKQHSESSRLLIKQAAQQRGPEWRRRISESNKGRKCSLELRAQMSAARRGLFGGKNNGFFGKTHSIETRARMSASQRKNVFQNNPHSKDGLKEATESAVMAKIKVIKESNSRRGQRETP
mgnify:CR=1 FL=1